MLYTSETKHVSKLPYQIKQTKLSSGTSNASLPVYDSETFDHSYSVLLHDFFRAIDETEIELAIKAIETFLLSKDKRNAAHRSELGENYAMYHFNDVVSKKAINPAIVRRSKRVKHIDQYRRQSFKAMSDQLEVSIDAIPLEVVPVADHKPISAKLTMPDTKAMKLARIAPVSLGDIPVTASGKPARQVTERKLGFNPLGRMASSSDLHARGMDEKTKAANMATRLFRVPLAIQLDNMLRHDKKLMAQAETAAKAKRFIRASHLIKQIELNRTKIALLVTEIEKENTGNEQFGILLGSIPYRHSVSAMPSK